MESMPPPLTTSAPRAALWEALPPALLGRCLQHGFRGGDRTAYFATCKAFSKAMLSSEPRLRLSVHVDNFHSALAIVLGWAEECHALYTLTIQGAGYKQPSSIQPLVQLLQQSDITFMGASNVTCQSLMFDSPGGLSAILPNLQHLEIDCCAISPGQLPLSGCTQLSRLSLDHSYVPYQQYGGIPHPTPPLDSGPTWQSQLQHLSTLPSLSALEVNLAKHPSAFLPPLAGQLTHLSVVTSAATYSQKDDAMSNIAQLSSLRSLEFGRTGLRSRLPFRGSITASHLATLSTLTQLQHLKVDFCVFEREDDVYRNLLQFPHLTSLDCDHHSVYPLQESLADSPCSWKHFTCSLVTPHQLAKLPLHSLTRLTHQTLHFRISQQVAEVQAAADNLVRAQPPCTVSSPDQQFMFEFKRSSEEEVSGAAPASSLVLAAKPLVPRNATWLRIEGCRDGHQMDAALVIALQEVLPMGVTTIHLHECDIHATAWSQLARSFPQLRWLDVVGTDRLSAVAVMAYYFARFADYKGPGVPQVTDMKITWRMDRGRWDPDGHDDTEWLATFAELHEQLGILGLPYGPDAETEWL